MGMREQLLSLVVKTSIDLPHDVETALERALTLSENGSGEASALRTMLSNAAMAREKRMPICQDTGTLMFVVEASSTLKRNVFQEAAEWAVAEATRLGVLRQNCVNSLTGKNTGNNLGIGSPVVHWHETDGAVSRVTLMLKGGGSENMGIQYSLPDSTLGAGRNLEGVRRCVLDAVHRAQGQGCAPGILGVCIGGDRATGYVESKLQLLRKIGERSPEPELAELEERLLKEANSLGIGAMGFGGRTTLLDVFIGWRCRLPASYFVSISYMCWCCRRQTMELTED
ncbi:MAG: fumarate hydratase [Victivallales bacterium]|jgi:fumarate hydratase class I|nr:fumarate hydratase [Victivallales bacterium]